MNVLKYIFFLSLIVLTVSCEDVVDVDLDTAPPRLVIEASIDWQKGTVGNNQQIVLSTTTGYYSEEIPRVSGASVSITNSTNTVFNFLEESDPGVYICSDFVPKLNETYTLTVNYDGETYKATETLLPVPVITRIEQNDDGGFSGEDIEVKFFYNDIPNSTNFYLNRFDSPYAVYPEYSVLKDQFFENNEMFGLFSNEDLKAGDRLNYTLFGISENYFNYMNILIAQTGSDGGSPFQTPPSTVRGNIVNQSNFDNFALGYFRLSETDKKEYIIQ